MDTVRKTGCSILPKKQKAAVLMFSIPDMCDPYTRNVQSNFRIVADESAVEKTFAENIGKARRQESAGGLFSDRFDRFLTLTAFEQIVFKNQQVHSRLIIVPL